MKKIFIYLLTLCTSLSIIASSSPVNAIDFSKNESYYIKLCSSNRLTNKNKKTCQQFNTYLKKKNNELKKDIKENKNDLQNTNDDISSVSNHTKSESAFWRAFTGVL